jgi:hypothetical protein
MARQLESLPRADGEPPSRDELFKLYEAALREYHLNITLGVQRQAFYIGLNVTLLGALASFAKGTPNWLTVIAYFVGAGASLLGAQVVAQTHRHYQASRDHFQAIEQRLGLDKQGLALTTTPGMRGDTGKRRMRVTTAAVFVLRMLALFDLVSAGWVTGHALRLL